MIKEGKKMKNLHQSILQERMKNANLDKLSGPFQWRLLLQISVIIDVDTAIIIAGRTYIGN